MRVLLDTNVLFDITAQREPFFQTEKTLLMAKLFDDVELWVSAKSYTDIFYIMNKQFESTDIQNAFLVGMKYFSICSVDGGAIKEAATRCWSDFEDALIAICAENIRADFLVSRDAKGFERANVPILSPEGLLEMIDKRLGITYQEFSA